MGWWGKQEEEKKPTGMQWAAGAAGSGLNTAASTVWASTKAGSGLLWRGSLWTGTKAVEQWDKTVSAVVGGGTAVATGTGIAAGVAKVQSITCILTGGFVPAGSATAKLMSLAALQGPNVAVATGAAAGVGAWYGLSSLREKLRSKL